MAVAVDLLYFASCPSYEATREEIERIAAETGAPIELRLVEVSSDEDAERLRFLGSPTVRVNGEDVEPGANSLESFVLACRIYRTEAGFSGQPSDAWIRAALEASAV